jgi:hypothetical protein
MPPIVAQAGSNEANFSKKILELHVPLTENAGVLSETKFS